MDDQEQLNPETFVDQHLAALAPPEVRIPRDADQRSELMSITIPK